MRKEFRDRVDAYMSQIRAADMSEIPEIKSAFFKWYNALTDNERAEIAPFWEEVKQEAWQIIDEVKGLIEELKALKEEELAEARK